MPDIQEKDPAGGRTPGRLPSLDGLRALAILLVLGSHFLYTAGFPFDAHSLAFVFLDGELGVRIFFVISGFIITRLLLDEDREYGSISLRLFYFRRALRILPVYYGYLSILAVFSMAGRYSDSASSWLGCLTFTRNLIGRGNSATEHFWSLSVEEQFYLCWPFLFLSLRLGKRRLLALIVLLVVTVLAVAVRHSFDPGDLSGSVLSRIVGARSLLRYADSLAIGCCGAFVYDSLAGFLARRLTAGLALLAALLLAAEQFFSREFTPRGTSSLPRDLVGALMPTAQAATLIVLMLCTLRFPRGFIYSLLNLKLMARIGVLSYSLYVWHFLFLKAFAPAIWRYAWVYSWAVWWLFAAVVSILSWEFMETPFLKLRRSLRRGSRE